MMPGTTGEPVSSTRVDRLRESGLFGGLGDEVLHELSRTLAVIELEEGALVVQEGDLGREMFVVLEGQVEVLRRTRDQQQARVGLLGPGDWFGEMSIVDLMPRSATVRVVSAARLLRITAHDLDLLYRRDLKSYALLVLNMARDLSRRLRVADAHAAEHLAAARPDHRQGERS